jgi:hypothetical protein
MSRDDVSGKVSYVFGAVALIGLIYFRFLPKPAALDFSGQMALSRVAFWAGIPTSVTVVLAVFFRRERNAKLLTIVYGAAMLFLWEMIAAGNLPVA